GHLDRDLDRGRAVVRVEHMGQTRRCACDQIARECGRRLVRNARERAMSERFALLTKHAKKARVAMPEGGDPPRRVAVEILATVSVVELRALRTRDDDGVFFFPLVDWRVGMPDVRLVEADDFGASETHFFFGAPASLSLPAGAGAPASAAGAA